MIKGYISNYDGKCLTIIAPFSENYLLDKQNITECEIILNDGRTISVDQRKKIYATLREISNYTGYSVEETKYIMKNFYTEKTGNKEFSLSDCDMTTARIFLTFLIDFCVEYGIQCKDSLLNRCEDISRYLYVCVIYRKCAICGAKADIHEVLHVGMGRDRNKINHLKQPVMPLCRKHHSECHYIGQSSFDNKYHIQSIKLDEYLCNIIDWKMVNENELKFETNIEENNL